jgi:hypothetical protein
VILQRGSGAANDALERQFGIKNLEGVEEQWRDTSLWLLLGLVRILDIKCFFYHLKENCNAELARIQKIKRLIATMRKDVMDLQEQIKYCSALGPFLRELKRSAGLRSGVGIQSIRRLEDSGVKSFAEVRALGLNGLIAQGVRKDIAKRIALFARKKMI